MTGTNHTPEPVDAEATIAGTTLSRRSFAAGVAAAGGLAVLGGWAPSAASALALGGAGDPRGPGSVSGAPDLPRGVTANFESRFVHANGIRHHVVVGGDGPPLVLVHGWPENWYAWRSVMPALANDFTVIAIDQRGIGLSELTVDGYDSANLANDVVGVVDALGYERFALVGHDTGYIIGYAVAADHRDRVDRVVLAEIPGPPGVGRENEPTLFVPEADNNRLWHIPFNRVDDELIVDMVRRSASDFYRYEFAVQGGGQTLHDRTIRYYVGLYTRTRDALRASFGLYRAWDETVAQNEARAMDALNLPVLAIGGERSWGALAGLALTPAATDVQTVVIPGSGHWVAEQAPHALLASVQPFLEPYRTSASGG
jgi:pimeloyl-ACP methyl ester carboxylesterase